MEYFIPLFTQAYDDLNQALYSTFQQQIDVRYGKMEKALEDIFALNKSTIKKNKQLERLHAEYYAVVAKNRLNLFKKRWLVYPVLR